ncbi:hypothetical protein BE17_01190 [Sorangium cellulosum]|uniref:Uncharacterized protein n=1 Tax=Sorangium cellulosum TaxID=56 RepID=A0A150SK93_SORCE|nr:hypothetical protein BE17_01190 [Sorangium cellulosum]
MMFLVHAYVLLTVYLTQPAVPTPEYVVEPIYVQLAVSIMSTEPWLAKPLPCSQTLAEHDVGVTVVVNAL